MRVAITGAGGRVGTHLARRLASNPHGHEIVALCRNFLAARNLTESGCSVRFGSIADPSIAPKLLEGCDVVVHCARASESMGRRDSHNLAMIQNIVRASSVKTLIFVSSVAVYGNCIESGIDTNEKPGPVDAYGKDKLRCEREAMREFSAQGRRPIILRMGHVYGAFQIWSGQILNLARDPNFRLPFSGRLLSNAISIERVCDAVTALLDAPASGIYNLTDEPQRTWSDVFAWHTKSCGLPAVSPLEDSESFRIRRNFLEAKRSSLGKFRREITAAVRTAAIQIANSNPMIKDLGSALVARAPGAVQSTIVRRYRRALIEHINVGQPDMAWEPWLGWLFSDPAPGPYLHLPATMSIDADRESEMQRELSRWFTRWATPDGIWRN